MRCCGPMRKPPARTSSWSRWCEAKISGTHTGSACPLPRRCSGVAMWLELPARLTERAALGEADVEAKAAGLRASSCTAGARRWSRPARPPKGIRRRHAPAAHWLVRCGRWRPTRRLRGSDEGRYRGAVLPAQATQLLRTARDRRPKLALTTWSLAASAQMSGDDGPRRTGGTDDAGRAARAGHGTAATTRARGPRAGRA